MYKKKPSLLILEIILLPLFITINIFTSPSTAVLAPPQVDAKFVANFATFCMIGMVSAGWLIVWLKRLRYQSKSTIADYIVYCEAKNTLIGIGLIWFMFLSSYLISMGNSFSSTEAWVAVFAIWALVLNWVLLRIRVVEGWYGYNSMEAMEIVRFVLSHSSGDINGPWGQKVLRSSEHEYVTSAEEVGRPVIDKALLNRYE